MSRKTHHVIPAKDGGWSVKKGGAEKASKSFDIKKDAIDYAREVSKNQESELYIHKKDGTIQKKDSHGNDPNPPKD
jgi:hypothetical protein